MGITVRKNMGIAMPDGISDIDFESRFLLRKLGAICKGGIHTGTVYMHTMVGPTDPKNNNFLEKMPFAYEQLQAVGY